LLHKPKLVWAHGPTQPGKNNDLQVFQQKLLPAIDALLGSKKAFGDGIYGREPNCDST